MTIEDQKRAALADWEVLKKGWDNDKIDISGYFVMHHYETIRACLQPAPCSKEVQEAVDRLRPDTHYRYTEGDQEERCNADLEILIKAATQGEKK